ncbi:trypsin alpha-like [Drosophila erecta]|uniref:trypsin n=1 Tax=Drosophila erecta TaxID=7220 RepID=B3N9I6_DROER|nr:trypsin alpha-like [Drosophila erecta]EDV57443.1 uncharacterized protein Dere_GG24537 [Drosophila erecta]
MFVKCFLLLLALNFLSAGRVNRPEERIINGSHIEIEDNPWIVSIQLSGQHICGGSIYSEDTIITAAHCFFDDKQIRKDVRLLKIRAGSISKLSGGTVLKVAAVITHENYFHQDLPIFDIKNDIAVVRLSKRLKFTSKVHPIPLANSNPYPGTEALIAGWGYTYTSDNKILSPITLRGASVEILSSKNCGVSHGQSTICAGYYEKTFCVGDSGGPLVINKELVGVVSGGNCISIGFVSSVPYFREWILNAIKSFP